MRKIITPAGLAFFLMAGTAYAATLPPPVASYDAVANVEAGSSHYTATINAAGPLERITTPVNGMDQTVLVDRRNDTVMLLVPGLNAAVPLEAKGNGHFDIRMLDNIPATLEGRETVLGLPATRYAVKGQTAEGSFDGHIWETADGIILKIEGDAVHNGQTTPVKAALTELHVRPQNPALFQLPSGMKQLPVGLNGLLKGAK